nr:EOG090X0QLW [Eurycercus lamellatus]
MNLRIHVALFVVFLAAHSVNSSIDSPSSKQVDNLKLKALDDLYIDDEGDDDIQLRDEASGSGPLKPTRLEEVEDEDDGGEDEDEDEDEDTGSSGEEVNKGKSVSTPVGSSSSSSSSNSNININADYKEDEVVPPKVSPVAASPSYPGASKPSSAAISNDDDDDGDFEDQGSGNGGGSGAGSVSTDDEDDHEEGTDDGTDDYDHEDENIEGIDINSVITDPEPKKPQVFAAPPTTPVKAPKEFGPVPPQSTPSQQPPVNSRDFPVEVTSTTTTTTTSSPSPAPSPVDPAISNTNDVHILDHKPDDRQASFFAQPGILAAVIGGAVVGLLCAILLVMFIVYRMRKKDEGSYVLDEPKRSSPNSHPYNKNSREFYA